MPGPVVLGNYELLDRITEGGMAEVWRARARGAAGFEKTVVIKRVLPTLMAKAGFADLLVREAKIAARLSHPGIVQIFELGEEGGSYFIAMEYVHGKDLGQAMAWRGGSAEGLSLPLRLWIVGEVAKALDHAHRRRGDDGRPMQIVHRDVSPQNILLGYEGDVKLADFGIARADESGLGRGEDPTILRGKYAYMSPEQARGEPLDRRSDLFSLGVVLYELVSGRRMFRGRTSQETLTLVREAKIPDITPEALQVGPEISRMLERTLAAARDDRFGWCGELANEITQFLFRRGEPVGQVELSAALDRMFPPEDALSPNKLRVDVMRRAFDDAQAVSQAGAVLASGEDAGADGDRTAAVPTSRRVRMEKRLIALLVAAEREDEDVAFARACEVGGGTVFGPFDGVRVGAFGHGAGTERAVAHAARAALELRRLTAELRFGTPQPSPAAAVIEGDGRITEGILLEPDLALVEAGRALVAGAPPGEIRLGGEAAADLEPTFRLSADRRTLVGFRARGDAYGDDVRRAPLVGRREDTQRFAAILDRVKGGQFEALSIVGEPGIGKSRLTAELRALASTRGFTFVGARGEESATERAYHVVADLVADLCGVEPEDPPAQRFAKVERLRVLNLKPREIRLLGELLGLAYPVASEERPGRPRGVELAVALRRALGMLAKDAPLVLAIEDLHWLDDASRQVLPIMLRGLSRPRVLLVTSRRAGATAPSLPGTTMRIGPLGKEAVGRLLAHALGARSVDAALATQVMNETAGNPLAIELVASELAAAGRVSVEGGIASPKGPVGPSPMPKVFARLVTARLEQLRPLDRGLLLAAAAFDGPVPASLVATCEGLVADAGASAFRRLFVRSLLAPRVPLEKLGHGAADVDPSAEPQGAWGGDQPSAVPPEVVVPGTLVRRAILESLEKAGRERLHTKIANVIERGERDPRSTDWLAYHAARSSDRRRAPDYLALAADAAEKRGELERAADRLAEAIDVLVSEGDDPSGERIVALALRAVPLALKAGADRLAQRVLVAARASAAARGPAAAGLAHAEALAALARGADREVVAIVERDRASATSPLDAARLAVVEARASLNLGRVARAEQALTQAVASLGREGDVLVEGRAQAHLADALARLGRFEEAERALAVALALAARSAHVELRFVSLAAMGHVRDGLGDAAGASARYREALEVASPTILETELGHIAVRAAVSALRAGHEAEASTRAQQAIEIGRKRSLEAVAALGAAAQATVAIATIADATYRDHVERAIERIEAARAPVELALALELLVRCAAAMDDAVLAAAAGARAITAAHEAEWPALARALADA
ncbi:MAG: protein kinase [Sandaracinus sp.]